MNASIRRSVRLVAFPILAAWLASVVLGRLMGAGEWATVGAVVVGIVVFAVMVKKVVAGNDRESDFDDIDI